MIKSRFSFLFFLSLCLGTFSTIAIVLPLQLRAAEVKVDSDPFLKLLSLGLQNSSEIKIQRLRYAQASNNYVSAWTNLLPVVSVSAGRTSSTSQSAEDPDTVTTSSTQNNLSVTGTWTIWNNYQNIRDIEVSGISKQSEALNNKKELDNYILSLLDSYLELQLIRNRRSITESFRDQAAWAKERSENLVKAGLNTSLDVLDAEIQLKNAERDLLELENTEKVGSRNLAILLNSEKPIDISTIDLGKYQPFFKSYFESQFSIWKQNMNSEILLKNRELKSAHLEIERSLAEHQQKRLSYLPSIGFSITHSINMDGRVNSNYDEYAQKNLDSTTYSLNLSWTLWDWFGTHREVQNSYFGLRSTQVNYEKTKYSKITEIENLIAQYETLNRSIEASELILKKSREQIDYSRELFRLGRIILLQMKQANTAYAESRINLMTRMKEKYILMAKLLSNFNSDFNPNSREVDWSSTPSF